MPSTRGGRADRHCRGWTPVFTSKGRAGVISITITQIIRICIKTRLELSDLEIVRAVTAGAKKVQPFLKFTLIQGAADILAGFTFPGAQGIDHEASKIL
jgi:hypothetical protein